MIFSKAGAEIFTMLASLGIIAGLYDQAWRVWKRQSADDLSIVIVICILLNEIAWFNFGVHKWTQDWVIVAVPSFNLPAAIWLAIGYFKYRKEGGADECQKETFRSD